MAKAEKLKVVKLEGAGAWKYQHPDGIVMVYGPRGEGLTNERINWLLDKAKDRKLHGQ